ncbi:hypothetical protein D3C72_1750120 [compost metagenome]
MLVQTPTLTPRVPLLEALLISKTEEVVQPHDVRLFVIWQFEGTVSTEDNAEFDPRYFSPRKFGLDGLQLFLELECLPTSFFNRRWSLLLPVLEPLAGMRGDLPFPMLEFDYKHHAVQDNDEIKLTF